MLFKRLAEAANLCVLRVSTRVLSASRRGSLRVRNLSFLKEIEPPISGGRRRLFGLLLLSSCQIYLPANERLSAHRHRSFPQSSSASRFTASAFAFFMLSQSGELDTFPRERGVELAPLTICQSR